MNNKNEIVSQFTEKWPQLEMDQNEINKLNKRVIEFIEEHLDLYEPNYPTLTCYDDSGNFDENKFNAILMHLGLTY